MTENIIIIVAAVLVIFCSMVLLGGCAPTAKGDELSSDIADNIRKCEPTPAPEYTIGDSVNYFVPVFHRMSYEIVRDPNTDVLYYRSTTGQSGGALTMLVKELVSITSMVSMSLV